MMTPQIAAMLQNNAGNPQMVSRIAQEQGVSQEEIAQALKIPAESAARYVPTDVSAPQGQAVAAQAPSLGAPAVEPTAMAGPSLDGGLQAQGGLSGTTGGSGAGPAGLGTATIADQGMKPPAAPPPVSAPGTKPMPMPRPGQPMPAQMGKPMMERPAAPAVKPAGFAQPVVSAGLRERPAAPAFKPAGFGQPMPAQVGKPMGGAGFSQPRGRPNFAGAQSGAGEQAFVNAFNRMRGNAK